jgi:hypothetical protein
MRKLLAVIAMWVGPNGGAFAGSAAAAPSETPNG